MEHQDWRNIQHVTLGVLEQYTVWALGRLEQYTAWSIRRIRVVYNMKH